MGLPVVTVASGGLPISDNTSTSKLGMPVTEATNKFGVAVTKVAGGAGSIPVVFETIGQGGGTPTVLDPATTFETTVSNGGLTATRTTYAADFYGGAHSVNYKTSGQYYFEVVVGARAGFSDSAGILSTTATYKNFTGDGVNCMAVIGGSGTIFSNDTNSTKGVGAYGPGDVLDFAVDLTARRGWIRRNGGNWNGDAAANPATGTGGVIIGTGSFAPGIGFATGSLNDSMTANFGTAAYNYTPPSGFANWTQ